MRLLSVGPDDNNARHKNIRHACSQASPTRFRIMKGTAGAPSLNETTPSRKSRGYNFSRSYSRFLMSFGVVIAILCAVSIKAEMQTGIPEEIDPNAPVPMKSSDEMPGPEILARMKLAFPDVPIHISGELQSKSSDGDIQATWLLDVDLHWTAYSADIRYQLSDFFGNPLSEYRVRQFPDGSLERSFDNGADGTPDPLPPLFEPIEEMDFTWGDLTFAFMWWTNAVNVGIEQKKGRTCYVVDVTAPPSHTGPDAGIRLWVDREWFALLQADRFDANEQIRAGMEVKSFKKVNGIWMFKDLEIQQYPGRQKTVFRVRDMETDTPETTEHE